ncbi:MAG: hypothetical protein NVS3B12_25640 [Acidimicrobiales bacterium]
MTSAPHLAACGLSFATGKGVVGALPAGLVVVGRADADVHVGPGGNRDAGELAIRRRCADDSQERRLTTQALFDRLGQQRPVGSHRLHLVAMGEQQVQEVA